MPKVKLDDEQLGELIDLLHTEIDRIRRSLQESEPHGPGAVMMAHQEQTYLEILEVLEDTP